MNKPLLAILATGDDADDIVHDVRRNILVRLELLNRARVFIVVLEYDRSSNKTRLNVLQRQVLTELGLSGKTNEREKRVLHPPWISSIASMYSRSISLTSSTEYPPSLL